MTSLLVLNRGLHIVDSITLRDVKSDGLARKSVDENLHSTTEVKYQVKSGLLLPTACLQKSNAAGLGEYPPLIRRRELQRVEPWGSGVESRCFL